MINDRERTGTNGNERERTGTNGNERERSGTNGNDRERTGTIENDGNERERTGLTPSVHSIDEFIQFDLEAVRYRLIRRGRCRKAGGDLGDAHLIDRPGP